MIVDVCVWESDTRRARNRIEFIHRNSDSRFIGEINSQ